MTLVRLSSALVLLAALQGFSIATRSFAQDVLDTKLGSDLSVTDGEGVCDWTSKHGESDNDSDKACPSSDNATHDLTGDISLDDVPEAAAAAAEPASSIILEPPAVPSLDPNSDPTTTSSALPKPPADAAPLAAPPATCPEPAQSTSLHTSHAPAPAPAPAPASQQSPAAVSTEELSRLRSLHQQARQALDLLSAELGRLEQRIAALTPGGAFPGPSTLAAAAGEWLRHFNSRWAVRLVPNPPLAPASGDAGAGAGAVGSDPAHAAVSELEGAKPAEAEAAAATAAAFIPGLVTCVFLFETPSPGPEGGQVQYVVVGDAAGSLHLLRPRDGALLARLPSGTPAAVTACSAYPVRKAESTVVTGHADGQTRSFAVHLQPPPAPQEQQGEQQEGRQPQRKKQSQRQHQQQSFNGNAAVGAVVALRHVVHSMPAGARPWPQPGTTNTMQAAAEAEAAVPGAAAAAQSNDTAAAGAAAAEAPAEAAAAEPGLEEQGAVAGEQRRGGPAPIMHILPYRLGPKSGGRRHVLVLDAAGQLRLERDNGTLRFWAPTQDTQLAVRMAGSHAVMLSASAATVLNTLQPRQPRRYNCAHLNGSRLSSACFDGHRVFRGYGVTARGELLSLITPHEGRLHLCKAHPVAPLPWPLVEALAAPTQEPTLPTQPSTAAASSSAASSSSSSSASTSSASSSSSASSTSAAPSSVGLHPPPQLTSLRGYLLLAHGAALSLLNTTGNIRTGGLPLVAATSGEELVNSGTIRLITAPDAAAAPTAPSDSQPAQPASPPPLLVSVAPLSQMTAVAVAGSSSSSGSFTRAAAAAAAADQAAPRGDEAQAAEGEAGAASSSSGSGTGEQGSRSEGGEVQGSVVLLFESRLPRVAAGGSTSKMWSQPIFIGAMLLVGLYQFWKMSQSRSQRARGGPLAGRVGLRSRRGYGPAGTEPYGDMYGEGRVPLQPRSALRRGRSDRPTGRSVSYEDDDY